MRRQQLVGYGGVAFVVAAPLLLATMIARSPDTHGHLWQSLHADYHRTPVEAIGEADLDKALASLPPFSFPQNAASKLLAAAGTTGQQAAAQGSGQMMAPAGAMGSMAMSQPTAEVQRITLNEEEYGITPDQITLKAGVPVELTVSNQGKKVHGLWIPEFGIAEDIRAGRTQVFRFTPTSPGRIRYTCSYSLCGLETEHARMVGFLIVQ